MTQADGHTDDAGDSAFADDPDEEQTNDNPCDWCGGECDENDECMDQACENCPDFVEDDDDLDEDDDNTADPAEPA